MATPVVRFEVEDTVVLRGNGTEIDLYGRVERTYNALDSHDPVEDCLIIAYVSIYPPIYSQFILSGRPPKGYLFVEFAREEDGHALLPEDSVELISRAVSIGDTVKQHTNTAMFGTVVDVQSQYLLGSVYRPPGTSYDPKSADPHNQASPLSQTDGSQPVSKTTNSISQPPMYEIDGDDLRMAEDFQAGDHVISHDWLGLVEMTDIDVAILLDNLTVVWVERPWELEIVVTNPRNKPLVSMPELDGIRRPDILNVDRNGIVSMPSKRLGCGDKVVTNRRNIERGRWIVGEYDPDTLPRGVVLDVRTRKLEVSWLVPNAFVDSSRAGTPPSSIRPYENLSSFRNPRELRARKDLARYDHHRKPISHEGANSTTRPISSTDVYYPGDRVRFRNPRQSQALPAKNTSGAKAELNQRGRSFTSSGNRPHEVPPNECYRTAATGDNVKARPEFVPRARTYEFDMNEYRICRGHHKAVVLWQDGTESTLTSTELTPYSLPETDLCPGDLVMGKEGMRMTGSDAEGRISTSDFNEMSFFEKDHILTPTRVGVVQSVDGQERLARVRWYADPHVRLSDFGQVLQDARFGKIGDEVEDVSSYEIMKAPVLVRKLGDFVVIPPDCPSPPLEPWRSFNLTPAEFFARNPPGPTTFSFLAQTNVNNLPRILNDMAHPFANTIHPTSSGIPKYDWLGEIIRFGLDGTITVRLGGMKDCQDVRTSHENILLIVDDDVFIGPGDAMDIESLDEDFASGDEENPPKWEEGNSHDSDEESAIDEVVEYEGGARLDEGSVEDDWSTDEDTPDSFVDARENHDDDDELRDTEMGGTELTEGEDENGVIRQRRGSFRSVLANAGSPGIAHRNTTPSAIQTTSFLVTYAPEVLLHDPASISLAQFLHQKQSPASFEVLEQVPPPDQYRCEQAPTENPAFFKCITKEHRVLATSLPPGEIYIRTYESRLDLLRCLIIGPADTPYEHCPFVVDLHLGSNFPKEPPSAHFHSWTSGLGRINPNLYEEGKICLSLLGTWPGQSSAEGWSEKATILQLLVSLQGLVFVSRPFYNEAGFEIYGEEKVYSLESQQYSEKAYVMARGFVKYALLKAPGGLEDVLAWLYLCTSEEGPGSRRAPRLLTKVIDRAKSLIEMSAMWKQTAALAGAGSAGAESSFLVDGVGEKADTTKTFLKPLSQGAAVMLRKMVVALEGTLQRYYSITMEGGERS